MVLHCLRVKSGLPRHSFSLQCCISSTSTCTGMLRRVDIYALNSCKADTAMLDCENKGGDLFPAIWCMQHTISNVSLLPAWATATGLGCVYFLGRKIFPHGVFLVVHQLLFLCVWQMNLRRSHWNSENLKFEWRLHKHLPWTADGCSLPVLVCQRAFQHIIHVPTSIRTYPNWGFCLRRLTLTEGFVYAKSDKRPHPLPQCLC